MLQYQGMVVLASNQVWWTWEVEDVFRRVGPAFVRKSWDSLQRVFAGQKRRQAGDEKLRRADARADRRARHENSTAAGEKRKEKVQFR